MEKEFNNKLYKISEVMVITLTRVFRVIRPSLSSRNSQCFKVNHIHDKSIVFPLQVNNIKYLILRKIKNW